MSESTSSSTTTTQIVLSTEEQEYIIGQRRKREEYIEKVKKIKHGREQFEENIKPLIFQKQNLVNKLYEIKKEQNELKEKERSAEMLKFELMNKIEKICEHSIPSPKDIFDNSSDNVSYYVFKCVYCDNLVNVFGFLHKNEIDKTEFMKECDERTIKMTELYNRTCKK